MVGEGGLGLPGLSAGEEGSADDTGPISEGCDAYVRVRQHRPEGVARGQRVTDPGGQGFAEAV